MDKQVKLKLDTPERRFSVWRSESLCVREIDETFLGNQVVPARSEGLADTVKTCPAP